MNSLWIFALRKVLPLGLSAFVAASSLAQPKAQSATKPVVYDTGYEILLPIGLPPLHWIDNDRLLFVGQKAGRGPRPDVRALYLWNASTKAVTFYADAKSVCAIDGIVRYPIRAEAARKRTVLEGPLGAEREVEEQQISKEEISRAPPIYSNFTCGYHLRRSLVPPADRFNHVVVLRRGDGYLDLEPGGGADLLERLRAPKKNLVLYQANGKAIELPMTWDERFSEPRIAFSAYRSAYVLQPYAPRGSPIGISGSWPRGQALIAYLLRRDGKVESVAFPYSVTDSVLRAPRPVVAGWIFGGGATPRTVGLYLLTGDFAAKLDSGAVEEITASADGCRAAVAIQHHPFESGSNPINVKILDFCTRRSDGRR